MKTNTDNPHQKIQSTLETLKLPWMRQNYEGLHRQALKKQTGALEYLHELLHGEALARQERSAERRIKAARLPALKTLDTFNWQWPASIDRAQVEHLASLRFVEHQHNGVLLGPVGVGKTHLATAIALKACRAGHKVLYTGAVEAINDLIAAQKQGQLKLALRKYTRPHLLVLDEIGYRSWQHACLFCFRTSGLDDGDFDFFSCRDFAAAGILPWALMPLDPYVCGVSVMVR